MFAVASPAEDFCEMLAWKVVAEIVKTWKFTLSDGTVLEPLAELNHPTGAILKQKMQFLDDILGLPTAQ